MNLWSDSQLSLSPFNRVERIKATHRQYASPPSSLPSFSGSRLFFWEKEGVFSGFILYREIDLDYLEVDYFCVTPPGNGKGGRLMEKFIGFKRPLIILLEVGSSNHAARRLYERFGFEIQGVRKNYYPSGDSALNMKYASKAPFA